MTDVTLIDIYANDRPIVHGFLFAVMAERLTEPGTNLAHTKMPAWDDHMAFINRRGYRAWYIVQNDVRNWVGCVSLNHEDEIGIVILKEFRRNGYGKAAVQELMRMHGDEIKERKSRFAAEIVPTNQASIALFTGLGAQHIKNVYHF